MIKKQVASLFWACISLSFLTISPSIGQTRVVLDLKVVNKDKINIEVYPPGNGDKWTYVAPEITPGTYWKANYRLFFNKIRAYAEDGSKLKIRRKGSRFYINGKGKNLHRISYQAEQTISNQGFRRFTSGCAGTVFRDEAFLLNFNAINGYFEGADEKEIQVEIKHDPEHYGSGSLKNISRSSEKDVFLASDYSDLVDRPLMYTKPDTTSFSIGENQFNLSIYSELDLVKKNVARDRLKLLMNVMDSFCGFQTTEPYHFLFFLVDRNKLKGLFGKVGLGAALEHKNSSVYYWSDRKRDSSLTSLDLVVTHEYLHTITPLALRSDRIDPFNFPDPLMSRHLWFYEGATDYLSSLARTIYKTSGSMSYDLNSAIQFNQKGKMRSMTRSGENITVKTVFDIPSKLKQVENAYERGKLIAFGLDVEMLRLSQGKRRLLDLMFDIQSGLEGKPFPDEDFRGLLVKYGYPELGGFYDRYIEGKEMVPFEEYFELLGWSFIPEKTKHPYFGIDIYYDSQRKIYFIYTNDKNSIGLQKEDVIKEINGVKINEASIRKGSLDPFNYPKEGQEITVLIERNNQQMELKGKADRIEKLKSSRIRKSRSFTEEQTKFRAWYLAK